MRRLVGCFTILTLALWLSASNAQQPAEKNGKTKDYSTSSIVTRMMAFDKEKTGKLTRAMVTDARLHRLFDEADADKDGVVTQAELMALAAKMDADGVGQSSGGKGGPGKGPGGPGGPGGFPRPGQILPNFMRENLDLTPEQTKLIDELQKEVDGKMDKILTGEQKKQLQEIRPGR